MKVVKKLVSSMVVVAIAMVLVLTNSSEAKAETINVIDDIIYDVEVNGLVDGAIGQTAQDYISKVSVSNNEKYDLVEVSVTGENSEGSWDSVYYNYEVNEFHSYINDDLAFEEGYSYHVSVRLKAHDESAFPPCDLVNLIYDDDTNSDSIECEGGLNEITVNYYFSFNGPINIARVKGIVIPKSGQTYGEWVNNIASLEEDKYTVESVYLYNHTIHGGTMSDDTIFRSGDLYIGSVVLKTNDSTIFAGALGCPEEHTSFSSRYRTSGDYRYVELDISFCAGYYESSLDVPVVSATCNGENSVKLSWKKVEGATSYQIYKYFPTSGVIQKSKEVTGTSTVFYNLKSGSSYKYIVQAVSEDKTSDNVNTEFAVDARAGKPAKSIITNVSYKYTNQSLKMSWDAVDGVSQYYVYKYWVSSNTLSEPKVVTTNSCKYYDKTPGYVTHARYVISTEKLDPSTFNGKGYVSFVLPAELTDPYGGGLHDYIYTT